MFLLISCNHLNNEISENNETQMEIPVEIETAVVDISNEEIIGDLIDLRLQALLTRDFDSYMKTVNQVDPYYYNEQSRWFTEMTKEGIENISLSLIGVETISENELIATIHQKHSNGESFDFEYPLVFKKSENEWLDYGYAFEELVTDNYTIKYMPGEQRVDLFALMIKNAYDNVDEFFDESIDDNFQIKLFYDREMLRQRTVPSIKWLFTGWGEPNESLKIYTGHTQFEGYQGTLQHEFVHHVTIKICNNNLSSWILEGIAMYYGNARYDHSISTTLANLDRNQIGLTIDELENTDLYNPESQQTVWNYYNTSYMYVSYLIETYGHDKLMALFHEAGKKPFHNSTMNETFEAENIKTTSEVIQTVLGLTKVELSEAYLDWLENLD